MNAETQIVKPQGGQAEKNTAHLLMMGLDGLRPFQEKTDALQDVLEVIEEIGDQETTKAAGKLATQIRAMEASVTMIGQVKAGKTSLVNAMVGWPDLLPADVNPWTSVVTSLHLNPNPYPQGNHSKFRFFDGEEWDRLTERGGRIGELAERTGANDEMERIRKQIEEMREKSKRRLGKKFEMLLGQTHEYGYFDGELIERYVCLGDDFEDDVELNANQGRFADITKSADLYLHRPEIPIPLCIRDTPGVNDTFMMREQITISSIRESRICVVVLSAHQALSSVDLALIRMISNVKSREVIIFVNRIDELPDPAKQVPEIRDAIRSTLKAHQGPEDAQIIFGSAYWGNNALTGGLDAMPKASAKALLNWAEGELPVDTGVLSPEEMVWELSGLPELFGAIAERVEEGVGRETLSRVARRATNLARAVQAKNRLAIEGNPAEAKCLIPISEVHAKLDALETRAYADLNERYNAILKDFHRRLDRAHKSFLDRATIALVTHLEKFGDEAVWSYNPNGLRILLRSAYQVFGKNAQTVCDAVLSQAAADVAEVYQSAFSTTRQDLAFETPPPPRLAPPVLLGQTIALDLKGKWWNRWWQRRRGYRAYAVEFGDMIQAETDPIINGLKETHCQDAHAAAQDALSEFLADQKLILINLMEQVQSGAFKEDSTDERGLVLSDSLATLEKIAA